MENSVQVNGKEVPIFGQWIKMNGAEAQSLCPCPMLLLFSADIIIVRMIPTNISWLSIDECLCPEMDNICYHPSGYRKPVVCAHKMVRNISQHLSTPPPPIDQIPNVSSPCGAVCFDSILLLVVVLQICILLLMLLFCFCSLRLATRCHTYSVNARRSIARRTQRAAAATLTAFNSRTSAPPSNVAEPLAIRGRRVAHETATTTTTTTHRVSGSV
ncbi:hypothetical protein niasHT_030575 [Heterodera trifolii]|uniref:Uncharacterized protein n=1 Tax=Heterodera trifolii TaxID=157864 RepID=A0ABD2ITK6_9BILA